jgi:broad-specificity NMP kinase
MRRILVTGMSGTGKSTVLEHLQRLGFEVVDTDGGRYTAWSEREGGYVWRDDRVAELLAREFGNALYVSGTVSNQGRFYPRFDAVVLLTAPADVLLDRIENRTTNHYGKTEEERELILSDLAEVEPLLRAGCTHEIDTTQPVEDVVAELVAIGRDEKSQ